MMSRFIPKDILPYADHSAALRLAAELEMAFTSFDIKDYVRKTQERAPDGSTQNRPDNDIILWPRRTAYHHLKNAIAKITADTGDGRGTRIRWPLPDDFTYSAGTELWMNHESLQQAVGSFPDQGEAPIDRIKLMNCHTRLAGISYWVGDQIVRQATSNSHNDFAVMSRAMERDSWCDPTQYNENDKTKWNHIVGPLQLFYSTLCKQAGKDEIDAFVSDLKASGHQSLLASNLIPEKEILNHILRPRFYGNPLENPSDFKYYRNFIRSICRQTRVPPSPPVPQGFFAHHIPAWLPLPRRSIELKIGANDVDMEIKVAISRTGRGPLADIGHMMHIFNLEPAWRFALFSQRVMGLIGWAFTGEEETPPPPDRWGGKHRIQVHLPRLTPHQNRQKWLRRFILPVHQGLMHSHKARSLLNAHTSWP